MVTGDGDVKSCEMFRSILEKTRSSAVQPESWYLS